MAGQTSGAEQQNAPADVLIVTALREERDAVRAVITGALGEWTEERAPSTGLRIERRSFRGAGDSELQVALICAEEMGSAQTVGVAGPVLMALRPRCIAMCGVLAGKPIDTDFGDVVFADQLLMHDTGKKTETSFQHATRPHKLDIRWLEKARDFAENPGDALAWLEGPPWTREQERNWLLDQFFRGFDPLARRALVNECCPSYSTLVAELMDEGLVQPDTEAPLTEKGRAHVKRERFRDPFWPELDPPRRSFKVHVAPMVAGNAVQVDPDLWKELSKFARKALGVEMESYGVGAAAELHQVELALVMKGVMDHADRHKDDRFKPFAARASAECLLAFLRAHLPRAASPDLADLLDTGISDPPKQGNPAALLHARHHVVPFYEAGRATLLADVAAWCREAEPVSARLFVGAGGMGKTRLFIEVAERMRAQGWLAGFFRREANVTAILPLLDASRPALVVIDYAESRAGLGSLLRLAAERRAARRAPLRVVLLARAVGDWWADLCQRDQDVGVLLREREVTDVAPLAHDKPERVEVFRQAAAAFAKHTKKSVPTSVPPLDDVMFERALYVHMAALMAVEGRDTAAGGLLENVLDHEERFWGPIGGSDRRGGRDEDQELARRAAVDAVRRVVTALTLRGGVSDVEEANAHIERLCGRRDESRALMLHDLYPGEVRRHGRYLYITGLEPDLLGEAMVLRALRRERDGAPRYLGRVLEGASEVEVEHAFDVLGRISALHPDDARPWIRAVLAQDVAGRAMAALRAAKSVGRRTAHAVLGEELAVALSRGGTAELANAIESAIPDTTVSLREVHAWALTRCLATLPNESEEHVASQRARLLNNLGNRQRELGHWEAALDSTQEAVDIYRKLASARPDAILSDLAMSLSNLGNQQRALGHREAALDSAQEAVDIYRKLALARPDTFPPDLAKSLNNLGVQHSALGRREAALDSTQEAVDIYRKLASAWPDAFLPDLAMSLNNLGIQHSALGRREAALDSTQEAVDIYRKLASTRPDAFLPDLAASLDNLGNRQSELGRREAALDSTQEAVDTYRKLVSARPDAFLPDLAMSLNNLGNRQSELGHREAALDSAQEAVDIRRKLVSAWPDAFLPDLAMSLNNLGNRQSELGHREAALDSAQESVDIRRKLASVRPDVFLPDLAASLNNLGARQSELGHREAALESTQEAVDIRRKLASAWPDAFLPELAASLNNLGNRQWELGHQESALATSRDALDVLWPFFLAKPSAFTRSTRAILLAVLRCLKALRQSPDAGTRARVAEYEHVTGEVLGVSLEEIPLVTASASCPCGSGSQFAECHGAEVTLAAP